MNFEDENDNLTAISQEGIVEILYRVAELAAIGHLETLAMLVAIPSSYDKKSELINGVCELCSCYARKTVNLNLKATAKNKEIFGFNTNQIPELN